MSDSDQNSQPYIRTYYGTHLIDIGKKLYLNPDSADVHFTFVSDDDTIKRVGAHKIILAAVSDIFNGMFNGDLEVEGDIRVTDALEAAFMEFLQFFYLDRVELTMENIAGVMLLGHKYNVPKCSSVCVRFLKDALTVDNIFIGLNLAIQYNQPELMKLCENVITLNTAAVFQTIGFMECNRQALAHILQMDVFSCTEVEVFKACMAWVKTKSEQNDLSRALIEQHLGSLYYKIRFKSMTMQELCILRSKYKPVLRSSFATITNMIVNREFRAADFNNQLRHAKWNSDDIVECNLIKSEAGSEAPYELWNKQTTTFSSDEPLLLGSFVCGKIQVQSRLGVRDLNMPLPVEVEVSEVRGSNSKSLMTMETKLQSNGENSIQLPYPILIRPDFLYRICIGPFPEEHIYHSQELKTFVFLNFPHYVQLHDHTTSAGDEKVIGLISCLNFNRL